jgi:hypothetical protein
MDKSIAIQSIREKYADIQHVLHQRGRRIWAATEAIQLGYGGITIVSDAIGMSHTTIRRGIEEIQSDAVKELPWGKSRLPGGGRKKTIDKYPNVQQELNALIEPVTSGDTESPLRWTCKSTYTLSEELKARNIDICRNTVGTLLYEIGYSLQANSKTREGIDHPDRNDQFLYI